MEKRAVHGIEEVAEAAILSRDVKTALTEEELTKKGFTSSIPWEDKKADCLVITCSDQQFQLQVLDFLTNLGFNVPHIIQVPSGMAIAHPLIATLGFLSKAVDVLLEKAIEATGVRDIICIAHEDCAVYNLESLKIVDFAVRRVSGKSVRDIQIEHLKKAATRLELNLRWVTVRTFFAEIVDEGIEHRVNFKEIPLPPKRRRGRG